MQPKRPSNVPLIVHSAGEARNWALSTALRGAYPLLDQVANVVFFVCFAAGLQVLRAEMLGSRRLGITLAMHPRLWPGLWLPWRRARLRNCARWAADPLLPAGWSMSVYITGSRDTRKWFD